MKKVISNIVKLFAQIDLNGILSSVIHVFFSSCGIVLILLFFDDSTKIYTHEEIKSYVISIFLLLCVLNVIAKVINHFVREPAMHLAQPLAKIPSAEEILWKKKDKRIIAVHEAGHAVMAYLKNS